MPIFNLCGIVDVGTYNSILDPSDSLGDDVEECQWNKFQFNQYMKVVTGLAVNELKQLLAGLPMRVTYVEGSAWIDSPKYYNYRNDMLCFQVESDTSMTEKQLQCYIEDKLERDINQEFNATYRIYEYLVGNCTIESFCE